MDLDWVFLKDTKELEKKKSNKKVNFGQVLLKTSFMQCESLLMTRFEFDMINNRIATFINPWFIKVFAPLNLNKFDCIGSHEFYQNYLAYNISDMYPSQYLNTINILDHHQNKIKVWNIGTGKFTSSKELNL